MTQLQQRILEDLQDVAAVVQNLKEQIGRDVKCGVAGCTDYYFGQLDYMQGSILRSLRVIRQEAGGPQ